MDRTVGARLYLCAFHFLRRNSYSSVPSLTVCISLRNVSCVGPENEGYTVWRGDRTGCFFCTDFVHFIFFVGIHTVQSHLYQLSPWAGCPHQHEIPPRCCLRRAHKGLRRAGHRRFHAVSGWRRGLRQRGLRRRRFALQRRRRLAVQRRWTTVPIAGDLGIATRRARRLVANGQSEDNDPRGGDRRAMGAVDALDCGEGGESPARRGRR